MKKLAAKGFTLVELMVVIVIVGILAAVAIPKFTVASHKAKCSEYPTVLSTMYQSEHTYQAENGSFATMTELAGDLTIPTSKYFSYTIESQNATRFSAQAALRQDIGKAVAGTDLANITMDGVKFAGGYLSTYASNWKQ
jgi:prepilin-type N-terminal cleavage/methylation domain-containing protein